MNNNELSKLDLENKTKKQEDLINEMLVEIPQSKYNYFLKKIKEISKPINGTTSEESKQHKNENEIYFYGIVMEESSRSAFGIIRIISCSLGNDFSGREIYFERRSDLRKEEPVVFHLATIDCNRKVSNPLVFKRALDIMNKSAVVAEIIRVNKAIDKNKSKDLCILENLRKRLSTVEEAYQLLLEND